MLTGEGGTLDRVVFSGAFSAFTVEGVVLLLLLFGWCAERDLETVIVECGKVQSCKGRQGRRLSLGWFGSSRNAR